MPRKTDLEHRVDGISKILLALMAYLAKRDDRLIMGTEDWIDFTEVLDAKIKDLRRLMEIPNADRTRGQRRQITLLRKELRTLKALRRLWEKHVSD